MKIHLHRGVFTTSEMSKFKSPASPASELSKTESWTGRDMPALEVPGCGLDGWEFVVLLTMSIGLFFRGRLGR